MRGTTTAMIASVIVGVSAYTTGPHAAVAEPTGLLRAANSVTCASWCATTPFAEEPWETKCGWKKCKGCADFAAQCQHLPEASPMAEASLLGAEVAIAPSCKDWCDDDGHVNVSWVVKCLWKSCALCPESLVHCATPSPLPSAVMPSSFSEMKTCAGSCMNAATASMAWTEKCGWMHCQGCPEWAVNCPEADELPASDEKKTRKLASMWQSADVGPCQEWCVDPTAGSDAATLPWETKCGWSECTGCPEYLVNCPSNPEVSPAPTASMAQEESQSELNQATDLLAETACLDWCTNPSHPAFTMPWSTKCHWLQCKSCDEFKSNCAVPPVGTAR